MKISKNLKLAYNLELSMALPNSTLYTNDSATLLLTFADEQWFAESFVDGAKRTKRPINSENEVEVLAELLAPIV